MLFLSMIKYLSVVVIDERERERERERVYMCYKNSSMHYLFILIKVGAVDNKAETIFVMR